MNESLFVSTQAVLAVANVQWQHLSVRLSEKPNRIFSIYFINNINKLVFIIDEQFVLVYMQYVWY